MTDGENVQYLTAQWETNVTLYLLRAQTDAQKTTPEQ
jgi:hypothetical protein